jgi:hypothetical protein
MSRTMKSQATEAFRVVVERYPGPQRANPNDAKETIHGPFATLAAARGAATRNASANYYGRKALPFRIQRTNNTWEDVK